MIKILPSGLPLSIPLMWKYTKKSGKKALPAPDLVRNSAPLPVLISRPNSSKSNSSKRKTLAVICSCRTVPRMFKPFSNSFKTTFRKKLDRDLKRNITLERKPSPSKLNRLAKKKNSSARNMNKFKKNTLKSSVASPDNLVNQAIKVSRVLRNSPDKFRLLSRADLVLASLGKRTSALDSNRRHSPSSSQPKQASSQASYDPVSQCARSGGVWKDNRCQFTTETQPQPGPQPQPYPTPTTFPGIGSCTQELANLLGYGCHNMGNAWFNSAMDRYVLPGTAEVKDCASNYLNGCSGSNTYSPTVPSGQKEQIWNAKGLRSWIRGAADPARIEHLRQACGNVPSGSNVWMPSSGDSASNDFGMPDASKCQRAAACSSTQYFDGASCSVSNATSSSCPAGQYWNGASCAVTSPTDYPSPSSTSSSGSCTQELTNLLGYGCHNMGNAWFNSAMDRY